MKRKLLAFIIFLVPILLMSCSLEQFLDENSGYDCELLNQLNSMGITLAQKILWDTETMAGVLNYYQMK